MKNRHNEINDNEIRIISADNSRTVRKKSPWLMAVVCGIAALLLIGILALVFFSGGDQTETAEKAVFTPDAELPAGDRHPESTAAADSTLTPMPFVTRTDTAINATGLTILTPDNATAHLVLGENFGNDSTAVLIAHAADVRADNGGIVGAYVIDGELISKGESKAGFCSIINGEISIGVAEATPMLEQALTTGGCFFRQYPLVVGGQIVENKPKGNALRRALAELDGRICIILSTDRLTFHDFSQALTDLGVRNAIYLVGGEAFCRYTESDGSRFTFGKKWDKEYENVNYIVWR